MKMKNLKQIIHLLLVIVKRHMELEREIERIFNVKNESSDAVNKLEMLKSKFEVLEKKRKLKGLLNCRKNIKLK